MIARAAPAGRRQQGVVLFVSLIMLVALTLAGLAVMRSVGSGVVITRNLVFKQGATASGDRAIEAARKWLIANKAGTTLNSDNSANGYMSFWDTTFDPMTYDWTGSNKSKSVGVDVSGNTTRYIIHRLCEDANAAVDASGQNCVSRSGSTGGGGGVSRGDLVGGGQNIVGKLTPYYRITVRAEGPLNTIAFVQAVID